MTAAQLSRINRGRDRLAKWDPVVVRANRVATPAALLATIAVGSWLG